MEEGRVVGHFLKGADEVEVQKARRRHHRRSRQCGQERLRGAGFWFHVGDPPPGLVNSSPEFETPGSVDIEASLKVARPSIRLSSREVKRGRHSFLGCEVIVIDDEDDRIYDLFYAALSESGAPTAAPAPAVAPASAAGP